MARITRRDFRQGDERARRSAGADRRHRTSPGTRARHRQLARREGHRLRQGRRHGHDARRLSPARGRDREAHGHHPSLRRRLLRRQQERRLHHQRREGARRPRLHERLRELSPADARLVAGADSRRQGCDPLDARECRAHRRRRRQDRRRRLLGGRHAGADGGRHERQARVRRHGRHAGRQLEGQCLHRRLSARERADRARSVRRRSARRRRPSRPLRRRRTSARASRRRSSFTARPTRRCRSHRASTSSPSCTRPNVPTALDGDPGRRSTRSTTARPTRSR